MDEDMEPMQENGGSEYVLVPTFPGAAEGGMASGPISAISGLPTSAYTVTKRKRKIVSVSYSGFTRSQTIPVRFRAWKILIC